MRIDISVIKKLFLCFWLFTLSLASHGEEVALQPFTSDGCSLFPNGTLQDMRLWCSCCLAHDVRYWAGGSETKRLEADKEFKNCVLNKSGNPLLANLMFQGVRIGGKPYFPTWFRWGYGWKQGRNYREPSYKEWLTIRELVDEYEQSNYSFQVCRETVLAPKDLFSVYLKDRQQIQAQGN